MKFEILVTRDVLTATCPGLNLFLLTLVSAEALQGESFIGFVVRKSVFRENDCGYRARQLAEERILDIGELT